MIALQREVRGEGNCVRATGGGEEACDRVRKRRVCCSPPGRDHVKAARLRTETRYKAGEVSAPRADRNLTLSYSSIENSAGRAAM